MVIGATVLLAFVSYGAGFYSAALPKSENQERATKRTSNNTGNSPSPVTDVARVVPPPAGDLQPHSNDQTNYASEDLIAQRVMAWWTRIMGFAAAIGIFLGSVSIWLIWRTWDETRRAANAGFAANEIARESARRQSRAYLNVSEILVQEPDSWPPDELDETKIHWSSRIAIKFTNNGQTPAEVCGFYVTVLWHIPPDAITMFKFENETEFTVHKGAPVQTHIQARADNDGLEERGTLYVLGRVDYRDAFGDKHTEKFCFLTSNKSAFADLGFPEQLSAFNSDEAIKLIGGNGN